MSIQILVNKMHETSSYKPKIHLPMEILNFKFDVVIIDPLTDELIAIWS